ncbi:MAG: hypothetical protein AB7N76_31820 [Planctomycetota bacterium]
MELLAGFDEGDQPLGRRDEDHLFASDPQLPLVLLADAQAAHEYLFDAVSLPLWRQACERELGAILAPYAELLDRSLPPT